MSEKPEAIEMWSMVVEASPEGSARALRALADKIEAANGELVLLMLASTGFAEPWEWCYQAALGLLDEGGRRSLR